MAWKIVGERTDRLPHIGAIFGLSGTLYSIRLEIGDNCAELVGGGHGNRLARIIAVLLHVRSAIYAIHKLKDSLILRLQGGVELFRVVANFFSHTSLQVGIMQQHLFNICY